LLQEGVQQWKELWFYGPPFLKTNQEAFLLAHLPKGRRLPVTQDTLHDIYQVMVSEVQELQNNEEEYDVYNFTPIRRYPKSDNRKEDGDQVSSN